MTSLSGKRALVTGASSGIGRGIALRLAADGASVAVAGRDESRTNETVSAIERAGGRAVAAIGDVSDVAQARAVVDGSNDLLGGLDIVVSNAGIDSPDVRDVHEWEVGEFDRILATNLRGPFLIAKFAIPHLLEAGGGSIVHISSVCAVTVWSGACAYDVSKAGLNMLSNHIAVEYGTRGIRSNTLMPATINTELHEALVAGMENGEEFERRSLERHPIGRFGTVEEIANACAWLCGDESPFMTGSNIPIDGAYSRP